MSGRVNCIGVVLRKMDSVIPLQIIVENSRFLTVFSYLFCTTLDENYSNSNMQFLFFLSHLVTLSVFPSLNT